MRTITLKIQPSGSDLGVNLALEKSCDPIGAMVDIPDAAPIQKAITELDSKIARLETRLSETRKQREALVGTLDYFFPKKSSPKAKRPVPHVTNPDVLRGKTLDEALLLIAEMNDGIVASTSARESLMEAGVLRGTQATASATLCDALSTSRLFRRESKGRYSLVEDQPISLVEHEHVNGAERPV